MAGEREIAVIIPTYKPGKYMEKCLASLESQSLDKSRYSVYICLNGPRHPYEKYVTEVVKETALDCHIFFSDVAGVSRARNLLIDSSVEPFLAFVDDDDVLSEGYLEGLLAVADSEYIGVSDVKIFDGDVDKLREHYAGRCFAKINHTEQSKFKARQFFSSPWAKMIHRDIIGGTRFDESLAKGEDSLFMAELSAGVAGVRKVKNGACYYVWARQGSASRKRTTIFQEMARVRYLLGKYSSMLFGKKYEVTFIGSRIAATLMHLAKSAMQNFKFI